jgi:hypothetical protein
MKKSSFLAPFWPLSWKPQVLSQISCRKYKVSKEKKNLPKIKPSKILGVGFTVCWK